QEAHRRRRGPAPTALGRAAEARPDHLSGPQLHRHPTRLAGIVRAIEPSPPTASLLLNHLSRVLIDSSQQLEPPGGPLFASDSEGARVCSRFLRAAPDRFPQLLC